MSNMRCEYTHRAIFLEVCVVVQVREVTLTVIRSVDCAMHVGSLAIRYGEYRYH